MGTTWRTEYYWDDAAGTMVPSRVERPSGFGRWPVIRRAPFPRGQLVAIIERDADGVYVTPGPAWTREWDAAAMLREHGFPYPPPTGPVGGPPDGLLHGLRDHVKYATARTTTAYARLADENRTTGFYFGVLEGEITFGGWTARIRHQNYSDQGEGAGDRR